MKTVRWMLAILLFPAIVVAQIARQGDEKADPTEFHSPMVLEAPFIAASPEFWKPKKDAVVNSPQLAGLGRFHCDGVSVGVNGLRPKEVAGEELATEIDFAVFNPGHDKFVKLLFQLLNGDSKVGESSIAPFKDKEGARIMKTVTLKARKADLLTEPMTTLRITMTTWNY